MLVTHNTVLVDCSDSGVGRGPIYIGDIDMSRLTSNVRVRLTVKTVDIYIYVSNPGLLSSSRWPSLISGRVRGHQWSLVTWPQPLMAPLSRAQLTQHLQRSAAPTPILSISRYYGSPFQSNTKKACKTTSLSHPNFSWRQLVWNTIH